MDIIPISTTKLLWIGKPGTIQAGVFGIALTTLKISFRFVLIIAYVYYSISF